MNKYHLSYINELPKESSRGLYLCWRIISQELLDISEWAAEENLGNDKYIWLGIYEWSAEGIKQGPLFGFKDSF